MTSGGRASPISEKRAATVSGEILFRRLVLSTRQGRIPRLVENTTSRRLWHAARKIERVPLMRTMYIGDGCSRRRKIRCNDVTLAEKKMSMPNITFFFYVTMYREGGSDSNGKETNKSWIKNTNARLHKEKNCTYLFITFLFLSICNISKLHFNSYKKRTKENKRIIIRHAKMTLALYRLEKIFDNIP